jgi:hypothetical protein
MNKPVTLSEWLKAMKLTFSLILVLVLVIAFFLGINLVLWFYYEWRDKPILELKTFINVEESWILQADKNLEYKKAEIQRLRGNASEQIKAEEFANSKILETAVKEYNALQTEYENRQKKYNEKVEEYNVLIKKTNTRWYVMPIPIKIR